MRLLQLFPILAIYVLLISATCIIKEETITGTPQTASVQNYGNTHVLKAHKLNLFQRLMVKILLKKHKLQNDTNADKLASTSLILGIGACAFILLGLFIPYIILASVPAGIAAMITGGSAIRNKTSLVGKAKTGKGLGLGALITFGIILILAAILVAAIY